MCTAATYQTKDFYMGRTLDYEFSYGEEVTITPRNYEFDFRYAGKAKTHYALIGMAFVAGDYPLYYDAANEKGLGMAGLNFVGNAAYADEATEADKDLVQVAQYEFIPWILAQCASVAEARRMLSNMKLRESPFSEQLPTAQLHWMIADKEECIVVESMKDECTSMTILLAYLQIILHSPVRCLHLTIMQVYPESSRKVHLQECWSWIHTAEEWAEWEFREIFQASQDL